jgi:hypothetical protein
LRKSPMKDCFPSGLGNVTAAVMRIYNPLSWHLSHSQLHMKWDETRIALSYLARLHYTAAGVARIPSCMWWGLYLGKGSVGYVHRGGSRMAGQRVYKIVQEMATEPRWMRKKVFCLRCWISVWARHVEVATWTGNAHLPWKMLQVEILLQTILSANLSVINCSFQTQVVVNRQTPLMATRQERIVTRGGRWL